MKKILSLFLFIVGAAQAQQVLEATAAQVVAGTAGPGYYISPRRLASGGGTVSSITGTAGQVTASAATGSVTLSLPAALTGRTSETASAATDLSLNAGSGNQNVNVTPSGTGFVVISQNAGALPTSLAGTTIRFAGNDAALCRILMDSFGTGVNSVLSARGARGTAGGGQSALQSGDTIFSFTGFGYGSTAYSSGNRGSFNLETSQIWTDANQGTQWTLKTTANSTTTTGTALVLTQAKNLLLGGLTTDGTGVLQFPAATTSAGGITFGADTNLYREAQGVLGFNDVSGTTITLRFRENGALSGNIGTVNGVMTVGTTTAANLLLQTNSTTFLTGDSSQNATFAKKITSYNGVTLAGNDVLTIPAYGTVTGASAAGTITGASITSAASDTVYHVSAEMNVTAATALSTTLTCTYTDVSNTSRTMIFPVQQLTGSFIAGGLITGTGAWETPVMHIKAKASTTITIAVAAGTFSGVTYSASAIVGQGS